MKQPILRLELLTFCATLLTLVCFHSRAQVQLKGTVIDEDNDPIEYVNVLVLTNDSTQSMIAGTTTDSLGRFQLVVKRGEYLIVSRHFGLQADSTVVFAERDKVIPSIQLRKLEVLLEGVTVVGKQPKVDRKVDRLVFNVNNTALVDGGTVIDALKVTPGVLAQGENIAVNGKQSFKLFINGKDQNLSVGESIDLLQTMEAKRVRSIEVITTPPSSMAAEGNIGIININLKSPLHDHWKAYLKSSQDIATYSDHSVRGNLSIQKGKLSINTYGSYSFGRWLSISEQAIYYTSEDMESQISSVENTNRCNWRLMGHYDLSKRSNLSVNYSGTWQEPLSENSSRTTFSHPNSEHSDSTIWTNFQRLRKYASHSGTVLFEHALDTTGKKLIASVDCFNILEQNEQQFRSTNASQGPNSILLDENSGSRNIINYNTNLDFILPNDFMALNFGAKFTHTISQSVLQYDISSQNSALNEDDFKFVESTFSGYVSGNKKLSKKVQLKAGLRLESTQTEGTSSNTGTSNTFNYTELFPTTHLSYAASEKHNLYFEYGRRINRPRFSMLNPFKIYISPFSYVSGNPFLRPSFSNDLRIGHLFDGNLSTSVFYKRVRNDYALLTILEEGTFNQGSVQENYLNREEFGLSQSVSFTIKKRFSSYLSANLSYRKVSSTNSSTRRITEGLNGYFYSNNSIYLNTKKTLSLNAELSYSIPSVYGIDRYAPVFVANVNVRMMFLKKRLVVNLAMNDVFASNKIQWSTEIDGLEIYNSFRSDNPYFSFSLSYSFGNNQVRSSRVKSGNNTEQMRSR